MHAASRDELRNPCGVDRRRARPTRDATITGAPARGVDAFRKHRCVVIRRDRDRRSIRETRSAIPEPTSAMARADRRTCAPVHDSTRALDDRVELLL
jgi:hypothetical protein